MSPRGAQVGLVAVVGYLDATRQFHHEEAAANPDRSRRRESALAGLGRGQRGLPSAATGIRGVSASNRATACFHSVP